jgi:O-antigen ligase
VFPVSQTTRGPKVLAGEIQGSALGFVGSHKASDYLSNLVLYAPLCGGVFLSKVAIPTLGRLGFGIDYLVPFIALVLGILSGRMRVDPLTTVLFLTLISFLGIVQVLWVETYSVPSMFLLAGLLCLYAFHVDGGDDRTRRAISFFLNVVTLLAVFGIAQFYLQYLVEPRLLFPLENFLPDILKVEGYATQNRMWSLGIEIYRPNGVFMLEASFFSQLLAIGIVAELSTFNRYARLALFAVALLVSQSGTGILILIVCLPLIVISQRRWDLVGIGVVALLLLAIAAPFLHLDILLSRANEFDSPESSGAQRFVGGFAMFDLFLWDNPVTAMLGLGAGNFDIYELKSPEPAAGMTLFKMFFEFGVIGALFYFAFIYFCLFRSGAPFMLRLAIAICLLTAGPYVLFFHGLALTLLVWPGSDRSKACGAAGLFGAAALRAAPAKTG